MDLHIWDTKPYSKLSTRPSHSEAKLRKLKNKYKYCSTYLLFPAIFERTVEPEKFCLSVRKASFYPKIHPSMINNTTTKSKYCSAPFRAPQYLQSSFYPKIHPSMINHIKISRSHTAFYCDILILWIKPYKLLTTFIPL